MPRNPLSYLHFLFSKVWFRRKTIINDWGKVIETPAPSWYGYIISMREGTWCRKCAEYYNLYDNSLRFVGSSREWKYINRRMTRGTDIYCTVCLKQIK